MHRGTVRQRRDCRGNNNKFMAYHVAFDALLAMNHHGESGSASPGIASSKTPPC